jgi:thioredoxin 1
MSDEDSELEKIKKRKLKELMKQSMKKETKTEPISEQKQQMEIIHLTDANFNSVVKNKKISLIDFWAQWCQPCLMMTVPFQNLSKKHPNIQFCKMNIDQHRRTALRYNIQSIPRFVFFKNGQLIHQVVGAVGEAGLEREIQRVLKIYTE